MATILKTISKNGQISKLNVDVTFDYSQEIVSNSYLKTTKVWPCNIMIDNVYYKNAFTSYYNVSKKTGRYSQTFTCNRTGLKFNDSHKKLVEHLLRMQN